MLNQVVKHRANSQRDGRYRGDGSELFDGAQGGVNTIVIYFYHDPTIASLTLRFY
jgi:hypothetical protein